MPNPLLVLLGALALAIATVPVALPGWLITRRRRRAALQAVAQAPRMAVEQPAGRPWGWGLVGRERRTERWLAAAEAATHRRYDKVEEQLSAGLRELEARLFRQLGLSSEEAAWVRLRTGEVPILSGVA